MSISEQSPLPETIGLFLHASAVVLDGKALLFLGHSTAGKSTLAHLLSPVCPLLADDTVYAWRRNTGEWMITNSKFRATLSGKLIRHPSTDELETSTPLKACFRIHKAAHIRTQPLHPSETARFLMDAALEVDVQRKAIRIKPSDIATAKSAMDASRALYQNWFRLVADIARSSPGFHLWFTRTPDIRELRKLLTNALLDQKTSSVSEIRCNIEAHQIY